MSRGEIWGPNFKEKKLGGRKSRERTTEDESTMIFSRGLVQVGGGEVTNKQKHL